MASRSIEVTLVNETAEDLTLTGTNLEHGVFASPPPINIGGNASGDWTAESDGFMTGTEGSATYAVGAAGVAHFRWDVPFVGDNQFSSAVSSGFSMLPDGGQGSNARLVLRLSGSLTEFTAFVPSQHGFPYANHWPPAPLLNVDLGFAQIPIGSADAGLCGGMVYTALDYFLDSKPVPPAQPVAVPGDPGYDRIVQRLVDSFDLPSLPLYLYSLQNPLYPESDVSGSPWDGLSVVMARRAWPEIRRSIDAGVPCPICLLRVRDANPLQLGHNHQVLVWGYGVDGTLVTLFVYDPNAPGDDSVTVAFDIADPRNPIAVSSSHPSLLPIFCFFPTAYRRAATP